MRVVHCLDNRSKESEFTAEFEGYLNLIARQFLLPVTGTHSKAKNVILSSGQGEIRIIDPENEKKTIKCRPRAVRCDRYVKTVRPARGDFDLVIGTGQPIAVIISEISGIAQIPGRGRR